MLDERGIQYNYREYTKDPLNESELRGVFKKLGMEPVELLRKNDKAYKELDLTGKEPAGKLIKLMAKHPTLLQRPIGIAGKRAVVGRPIENLLEIY